MTTPEKAKKRSKLERRVSLKMSPDLYGAIEQEADRERRSVNNLVLLLLEEALKARGVTHE